MTRRKDADDADEQQTIEEVREVENDSPTSSDVGKQTQTKADLGYDPAAPVDAPDVPEAFATPRHPDDPSGDPENQKVNDPS